MHTKSLKHPLIEVGYSNRPQARLKKHTSHSSTNYAVYLAESVATVLFDRGSLKKLYEMKLSSSSATHSHMMHSQESFLPDPPRATWAMAVGSITTQPDEATILH
jgi:hypothetical protein